MGSRTTRAIRAGVLLFTLVSIPLAAKDFSLTLRSRPADDARSAPQTRAETWPAERTAVIVCDVWDLHHCLNAVRRLEEFAPRLNEVIETARRSGATIIHAPSDCMEAYATHPARLRAKSEPIAEKLPPDIQSWCSKIPSEEQAVYPVDQSDGGEDDDPAEHAAWATKLKEMGRNPGTPWKQQSELIRIDADRDYITDRGEEVWSILTNHDLDRVILTGVHCNMCVLGRPFGLRQMARNGKQVVLMRDMTDSMYNPKRWPFVDHFTGNELVVAHVERYVCPSITSDQLLGGKPFRSKYDTRPDSAVDKTPVIPPRPEKNQQSSHWRITPIPAEQAELVGSTGAVWTRCAVRIPERWVATGSLTLVAPSSPGALRVWINGEPLATDKSTATEVRFVLPVESISRNDANLLVMRWSSGDGLRSIPEITAGKQQLSLRGRWQYRTDDHPAHAGLPLPARFGVGTDVVFQPPFTEFERDVPRTLAAQ